MVYFEVSELYYVQLFCFLVMKIGKYMYLSLTRNCFWLQDFSLSYIAGVSYIFRVVYLPHLFCRNKL